MKFWTFVKRFVISDPHLSAAFLLLFFWLIVETLHGLGEIKRDVPTGGLLFVVALGILALVADHLKEGEEARINTEKISRIASSVSDKKVVLRERPSLPEDYIYLWGGFTGMYYAYNPSYRLDQNIAEEDLVNVFVHRYQNPYFKTARYVFLTGDEAGKTALHIFREIMEKVEEKDAAVAKKVEVREFKNKAASSEAEMYLGTRNGRPTGVLELKEPGLDPQHGMPHYYLVVNDEGVVKHYLKNHFEPAWNNPECNKPDHPVFKQR